MGVVKIEGAKHITDSYLWNMWGDDSGLGKCWITTEIL